MGDGSLEPSHDNYVVDVDNKSYFKLVLWGLRWNYRLYVFMGET